MRIPIDLQTASQHIRLLSDTTRARLLFLLEQEELSVAELAAITRLAQPRVSTHLAKLREAGMVNDRRDGASVYYRLSSRQDNPQLTALWETFCESVRDPLVEQDRNRISDILAQRTAGRNWADSVAGDMDRHYSPGRTWEATARALVHLLKLGDVVDIASGDGVMAELLSEHARSITCFDISDHILKAARNRLQGKANVSFQKGDMHDLQLADNSMDTVLLMHALTYTADPQTVFNEAARVLRPGGQLLAATLLEHKHKRAVSSFDHLNQGFSQADLQSFCGTAGLQVNYCTTSSIEKRPPHFAVLTLLASLPIAAE